MEKSYGQGDPHIAEYVTRLFAQDDVVLGEIRARSQARGLPDIAVSPMDGRHLEVLARLGNVRRAVEIGTLGGYSGVCLLRGMADGVLHALELDPECADVARESFARAGFASRARVTVGPALTTLPSLVAEGPFDLVFVDADKVSYPEYVEWAADNLRVGGVVICDNAFLFGEVIREPADAPNEARAILAMRRCHELLALGGRFVATILPTGEGLAVGVKVR